ncbi:MAG: preprotein translocase subunit YajC [Verrucomicrobia bacterium 21-51-4]|nr:MAG: preprotein translocase subunit YajC [Verrucomicrobia bacterium 21-51-4]
MNSNTLYQCFADAQASSPFGDGMSGQLIIMGLLFAGMWFLIIAPQRKKQKVHSKMIESLQTGDEVLTNGGIYGVITNTKNDRVIIKISDSTKIEVNRAFIQSKVEAAQAAS